MAQPRDPPVLSEELALFVKTGMKLKEYKFHVTFCQLLENSYGERGLYYDEVETLIDQIIALQTKVDVKNKQAVKTLRELYEVFFISSFVCLCSKCHKFSNYDYACFLHCSSCNLKGICGECAKVADYGSERITCGGQTCKPVISTLHYENGGGHLEQWSYEYILPDILDGDGDEYQYIATLAVKQIIEYHYLDEGKLLELQWDNRSVKNKFMNQMCRWESFIKYLQHEIIIGNYCLNKIRMYYFG